MAITKKNKNTENSSSEITPSVNISDQPVKSKRGRKPKNPEVKKDQSGMYFSEVTQKKISEYKSATNEEEKTKDG